MSTNFPGLSVEAKPIFVVYQSTDQAILTAAAEATITTISSGSTGGTAVVSSTGSPSISGSALAGAVVGSMLGAAVLFSVLTFVLLRFCMGYRKQRAAVSSEKIERKDVSVWGEDQADERSLPHQQHASELASPGQLLMGRSELDS